MTKFKLTEIQATAILDMQLRRLAALERQKIEDEYKQTMKLIKELEELLASPKKILEVIEGELKDLREKYGDKRRTRVFSQAAGEYSEEDLIPSEQAIVTITKSGYIKRSPLSTFRTQGRGGKGVVGLTMKEEDAVSSIFAANTHDSLLFFTRSGKVFQLKVYDLPEGSRISKGTAIVNLIDVDQGDDVTAILAIPKEKKTGFLFMGTKNGVVKKTPLEDFAHIRRSGVIAINLTRGDELKFVLLTEGSDEIIIVTKNGMSIVFSEKDARSMGRATAGVIGIRLKAGDEVVGVEKVVKNTDLLVVTERGLGKRTKLSDWPRQSRAGSGVKAAQISSRNGPIVGAEVVEKTHDDILITTKHGQVIKLPVKDVPVLTRQTQGVILIRLAKGDIVAAVAALKKEQKEKLSQTQAEA